MVLWAPAIGIGENNVEKWRSTLLKHAQTATDISLEKAYLEKINSELQIIHGTEDEVVEIENSREIYETLPKCEFTEIENTGHSFTGEENRLIPMTTKFIRKQN